MLATVKLGTVAHHRDQCFLHRLHEQLPMRLAIVLLKGIARKSFAHVKELFNQPSANDACQKDGQQEQYGNGNREKDGHNSSKGEPSGLIMRVPAKARTRRAAARSIAFPAQTLAPPSRLAQQCLLGK